MASCKRWENWLSSQFGTKFQWKVPLLLEIVEFPPSTMYGKLRAISVPKKSLSPPRVQTLVRIAVFLPHRSDSMYQSRWNLEWKRILLVCSSIPNSSLIDIRDGCGRPKVQNFMLHTVFFGGSSHCRDNSVPIMAKFVMEEYSVNFLSCRIWPWTSMGDEYGAPDFKIVSKWLYFVLYNSVLEAKAHRRVTLQCLHALLSADWWRVIGGPNL